MATLAYQTAALLDFNRKLDRGLLDSVVVSMYAGNYEIQRMVQGVLTTLNEHPDAWTRVDTILEYSTNLQTKYYALQAML
ncbi:emb [Trypoxylus dichotomus]